MDINGRLHYIFVGLIFGSSKCSFKNSTVTGKLDLKFSSKLFPGFKGKVLKLYEIYFRHIHVIGI